MSQDELSLETHRQALEFLRIANCAAKRAQEENRKKGIPNVYSFNEHIYYELPNGALTKNKKRIDALISANNAPKCPKVVS